MSVDADPNSAWPEKLGIDIACSFMIGILSFDVSADVDVISILLQHSEVATGSFGFLSFLGVLAILYSSLLEYVGVAVVPCSS